MSEPTTTERYLAIGVGILILAAATDLAVRKAGGYDSDYSRLLIALAAGVVTGAYILGRAWSVSRKIAIVILLTLCCGEGYNLWQTAERVMSAREAGRAPSRAALKQHQEAEDALKTAQGAQVTSARLTLALAAKGEADKAYEKELREGGRCKTICLGLEAKAEASQTEVKSALAEAEAMKATAISAAKADLAAHPLPASGTASSDETGVPVWVIDLVSAMLLSLGANGLAAGLIAFGAHSTGKDSSRVAANDADQTDFPASDFDAAKIKALVAGEIPGKPTPPNKPRKRGRKADQNVIDFTQKFREKNGRTPSGSELRRQFPALPVSTAYDYASRARVAV